MFVILWEFDVKPGCENRFELVYGPSGDWAQLFRTDSQYHVTRLLRDTSQLNLYLTVDSWLTRAAYELFLQAHHGEYEALDAVCEGLTINERRIGAFEDINLL